ncbi:MAG: redox-sensing transcriptional repressor Rex [Bacteroidetes bacterium]|nr:redox-sensing transcriptional repressor Rex [Bacteroidota bacterium]
MESISKAAFRRLPRYHQILNAFEGLGREYISSRELSEILEINETLVRKDMADLKIRGKQNQGYSIAALRLRIEDFLGLQEITEALVVGAGHLGTALATYAGFEHYGLKIVGVFDSDPEKIGKRQGAHDVLPVSRLASVIQRKQIRMIILTVPREVAQGIIDTAVGAGVLAVWNFTPCELNVPPGVKVRNEQIVGGFMALSYYLKNVSGGGED